MRERDVRYWPTADMRKCTAHVCFGGGVERTDAEQNGITQGFLVFFSFEKPACLNSCVNKTPSPSGRPPAIRVLICGGNRRPFRSNEWRKLTRPRRKNPLGFVGGIALNAARKKPRARQEGGTARDHRRPGPLLFSEK